MILVYYVDFKMNRRRWLRMEFLKFGKNSNKC